MSDKPKCECCGRADELRQMPALMSGRSNYREGRAICSYCFAIWYDTGITSANEIAEECRRAEAAGEFPFRVTEVA